MNNGQSFPSPGNLPNSGIELRSPALQADSLPSEPQKRFLYVFHIRVCVCVCVCVCVQLLQSHLTLCNLMHCSWPDSSVHRIFPEKTLEWIVILSSRGILLTQGSKLCLLPLLHCRLSHWERQPTMQSRKMDYCLYPLVCETKQYPCNNWPQMVRT